MAEILVSGIETARLALSPARLALDPGDVVQLDHDGRIRNYRIVSAADDRHRALELVRMDRDHYDLPPGQARIARLPGGAIPVAPLFDLMDFAAAQRGPRGPPAPDHGLVIALARHPGHLARAGCARM